MLTTLAPLTVTGTILLIGTTIGVFVSSKLFVPEFFVVMQKSVPFKVHYLLRETCSIGGVGCKNQLYFQKEYYG
jgi:hypothetical protein